MENNFYVGNVIHKRKFLRFKYSKPEKIVLYTEDNYNYIDLVGERNYTTNQKNKDYVMESSLIPTDVSEHKIDYLYLLDKNKAKTKQKVKQ